MPRNGPDLGAEEFRRLFERREEGFRRLEDWHTVNPQPMTARAAWNGIAFLYELLPPESRGRPIEVDGVRQLHHALAGLSADSS